MLRKLLLVSVAVCVCASGATPIAQSDLDALMERVLLKRDDNWKKLQQYVLEERETMEVTALDGRRVYGFKREYQWFPRQGFFIKSPLTSDGVKIGEGERRIQEARWLAREQFREKRRAEVAAGKQPADSDDGKVTSGIGPGGVNTDFEAALRDSLEPGFVSAAYFLDFKFEQGQYALVGRETYEGHDVLKLEYYPMKMFTGGRGRPNRQLRERNKEIGRQMNKVSIVTLWIEPQDRQIVKYDFDNVNADFFPGQWLMQLEGVNASMEMSQPFPGVWLPRVIRMSFDVALAGGNVKGKYSSEYYDYRLAEVTQRVR
ncbi:MAG TPA: hypothetical protein VFD21_16080 [Vicinamibacterales bacterium]|nr:hypothetical protein [Vicinamibacterales bacterium]